MYRKNAARSLQCFNYFSSITNRREIINFIPPTLFNNIVYTLLLFDVRECGILFKIVLYINISSTLGRRRRQVCYKLPSLPNINPTNRQLSRYVTAIGWVVLSVNFTDEIFFFYMFLGVYQYPIVNCIHSIDKHIILQDIAV